MNKNGAQGPNRDQGKYLKWFILSISFLGAMLLLLSLAVNVAGTEKKKVVPRDRAITEKDAVALLQEQHEGE